MPSFRLAILECDTPIDSVRRRYNSYGDIFVNILKPALEGLPSKSAIEPVFTSWNVVDKQEYPDLEQVDGILLTGSSTLPPLSKHNFPPSHVQSINLAHIH